MRSVTGAANARRDSRGMASPVPRAAAPSPKARREKRGSFMEIPPRGSAPMDSGLVWLSYKYTTTERAGRQWRRRRGADLAAEAVRLQSAHAERQGEQAAGFRRVAALLPIMTAERGDV